MSTPLCSRKRSGRQHRRWKARTLSLTLLMLSHCAFAAAPMSVEKAVSYQIPENPCSRPEVITSGSDDAPLVQDPANPVLVQGSNTANIAEMDTAERKRQERKEKRWRKCLAEYKQGLLEDMERLKSSAAHGLTQQQADAILTNMAKIQRVYLSPDGVPEAAEPPDAGQ